MFLIPCVHWAQGELIFESDELRIYHSFASKTTEDNLFPTPHDNGMFYISGHESNVYNLYYAPEDGPSKKIRVSQRFRLGGMAVSGNDFYLTGLSVKSYQNARNLVIYKGILEDNKISKIKPLPLCDPKYFYAHPTLSPDGSKMAIVTNEKGRIHLLELEKDENGAWTRSKVIFIAHPSFDILNPTYFDNNTLYFSSNFNGEEEIDKVYVEKVADSVKVVDVNWKPSDYNIYRITRAKDTWQVPEPVNALNSEFDELGVLFTTESSGFLTTYRYNNTDNIYYFEIR
jgi:hypothetical protein